MAGAPLDPDDPDDRVYDSVMTGQFQAPFFDAPTDQPLPDSTYCQSTYPPYRVWKLPDDQNCPEGMTTLDDAIGEQLWEAQQLGLPTGEIPIPEEPGEPPSVLPVIIPPARPVRPPGTKAAPGCMPYADALDLLFKLGSLKLPEGADVCRRPRPPRYPRNPRPKRRPRPPRPPRNRRKPRWPRPPRPPRKPRDPRDPGTKEQGCDWFCLITAGDPCKVPPPTPLCIPKGEKFRSLKANETLMPTGGQSDCTKRQCTPTGGITIFDLSRVRIRGKCMPPEAKIKFYRKKKPRGPKSPLSIPPSALPFARPRIYIQRVWRVSCFNSGVAVFDHAPTHGEVCDALPMCCIPGK